MNGGRMRHRTIAALGLVLLLLAVRPGLAQDFGNFSEDDEPIGEEEPAEGEGPGDGGSPDDGGEEAEFEGWDDPDRPVLPAGKRDGVGTGSSGAGVGAGGVGAGGVGVMGGADAGTRGPEGTSAGTPSWVLPNGEIDPDYVKLIRLGMPSDEWENYLSLRESRRYTPAHYYNRSVGGLGPLVAGWVLTMGGLVVAGIGGVFMLKAPPEPGDDCDFGDCWGQSFTRALFMTEGATFAVLGAGMAIGGVIMIGVGERKNERWLHRDSDLDGASDSDFERYRRRGPWPQDESSTGPQFLVVPVAMPDGAGAGAVVTF